MKMNLPKNLKIPKVSGLENLPKLQGRGLTTPGIIVMQILFIFFVSTIEIFFGDEPSTFTGLTLWFLLYAAISIGRKGTLFTAVVWLPITLTSTLFLTLATVGGKGFAPTKLGIALVTSLARLAPYLVVVTVLGWAIYYLREIRPGQRADLS
jgi:hypothetical protein